MDTILQEELETYQKQKKQLLKMASGKYVLIHEDQVLGTFDTEGNAVNQGYRQLGNIAFLVKKIEVVEKILMFYSL